MLYLALDPFPSFLRWLEAIVVDELPAEFFIDEEGKAKTVRASLGIATSENQDEFIFEILERYWVAKEKDDERPIYLYVQVIKQQFLSEFLKRWDDFIENQYDPLHWEKFGSDLRQLDVTKVRSYMEG